MTCPTRSLGEPSIPELLLLKGRKKSTNQCLLTHRESRNSELNHFKRPPQFWFINYICSTDTHMPTIKGYSINRMLRNSYLRRSMEDTLKVFHSLKIIGNWVLFYLSKFPLCFFSISCHLLNNTNSHFNSTNRVAANSLGGEMHHLTWRGN